MFDLIGKWVLKMSGEYLWFDDLVDLLWRGRTKRALVLCPWNAVPEMEGYADWMREQGPWTLELMGVEGDDMEPGQFDLVAFRGWSLFRWTDRTDVYRMEAGVGFAA